MLNFVENTRDELLKNFSCCIVAAMDNEDNVNISAGGGNLDFPRCMVMLAEIMGESLPDDLVDDEIFWDFLKKQVKRIKAELIMGDML